MHTVTELETSVPAFLGKLWKLVEDPETDDLICWAPNGRSFFIRNPAQFARELLPHYYKHNNMASFVRQLNMYGFHKKVSVELGGLKCDRDEMEFAHQYFIKGHPYLLEHIKRKIASSKSQDSHPPMKSEMMNKVLAEVRTMRGRQEHLDSRLGAMKRENEALWRELAMLRRKHLKQQEIVNKLIHFLVTLVQPQRNGGLSVKRRYPLMIDDRQCSKHQKMSKPETSPTGPVIHELDGEHEHDLDSQYIVAEMLENHQIPAIQSPQSIEAILDDDNTETVYHIDNSATVDEEMRILEEQEAASRRRLVKPKKKRKNKVPVKILIPSSTIGEEPREETVMLELNPEESALPIALLENDVKQKPKPVPLKTVRSSKLAAMAANINKLNETEVDMEDSDDVEEEPPKDQNPSNTSLNDILIIPEIMSENDNETINENPLNEQIGISSVQDEDDAGTFLDRLQKQQDQEQAKESGSKTAYESDAGSSVKSKDLSLSRVNPTGIKDATYRLGSMEEMDNHLETMQSELENLRDILRGEGYSIDANTLLGLFGGDDPMSFGIPMNPELDPTGRDKDDDEHMNESQGPTGGELMAYNPASSLLDFDDDIFLGATSPSLSAQAGNISANNCYSQDPLDLGDRKTSLLESLVAGTDGNSSRKS